MYSFGTRKVKSKSVSISDIAFPKFKATCPKPQFRLDSVYKSIRMLFTFNI